MTKSVFLLTEPLTVPPALRISSPASSRDMELSVPVSTQGLLVEGALIKPQRVNIHRAGHNPEEYQIIAARFVEDHPARKVFDQP